MRGVTIYKFMMWMLLFLFVLVVIYWFFVPSQKKASLHTLQHSIVYQGKVYKYAPKISNNTVKIPLSFLHKTLKLTDEIYYEKSSETIVITNAQQTLKMQTANLDAVVNQKSLTLRQAAEVDNGELYLPAVLLEQFFNFKVELSSAGIVTVLHLNEPIEKATVSEQTAIRLKPSIRQPILEKLAPKQNIRIYGDSNKQGWYRVQGNTGVVGYVPIQTVKLKSFERFDLPQADKYIPWKVTGQKINMVWEAVHRKTASDEQIGALDGVNVVSPTWFELMTSEGDIKSKADQAYLDWAALSGRKVWALFSNSFDAELTTQALSTADRRFHMIQQITAFAKVYHLQGINIDFENVYTKDKNNFVQFIRELTPIMHEMNVSVSVDVTPKSNSEMWSVFLDRPRLAEAADYLILMAYDEHWASSPEAGSVASLPWTEASVRKLIDEDKIPVDKIILGIPLYARMWTETTQKDGSVKVSSIAMRMPAVENWLRDNNVTPKFDPTSGQNYAEYKVSDNVKKRIWIEDELSIQSRMAIIKKYNLAGSAAWNRSFANETIWTVIKQQLNRVP